ncbi:dolichyl-diphosphooligosaccharide--protein glycosyltransferase [Marine Group I thaumarchaeote SCGC AAA799-P11]|uniref:dolichyl-phosphooligosaccharide-protein glycotransferase n=1 Tax=Marine Group I thaumarchaeote SCGC AAA799-P11 TaxID=1502295 RepID=A0A087S0L7_9ARCH|nr:dolichyl-diphosphooligosaccharide--protein glycosyltransferase [Marine Group I thaumarchaeote SCGC AAA799-P11]
MNSNSTLVSIGKFDLNLNHLLIIGILSLSFSISFLIRSQPADYGWELNEFDPFFNYRATQYVVDNGIDAYFQWDDELSWYPNGRDVSKNSQVMLHLTAATTYWIFGGGGNLYDFTILFPVVFGSLTCIVVFALVRVIGGTTAGLFSALFFSLSLPIIIRGQLGWFKSEPLGLFFSVLALYLFLSGISSKNHKIAFIKLVSSGIFLIFGLSSWGGNQFFIIVLGIFFLTLPFVRNDHKFLSWAIPIFTISTILFSLGFERLSTDFIFGLGGLSLIIPTIFLVSCSIIQNKSNDKSKTRNGLLFLAAFLIISLSFVIISIDSDFISLPSFRYLNAINPFLTTTDPLVDSVAEHSTTTIQQSFLFHSILMIFAGIGVWLIIKSKNNLKKNDMISFSLIIGLIGVYISSAFLRLEIFASLSIIILSSLGISILLKEFLSMNFETNKFKNLITKSSFVLGLIILLLIPFTFSYGTSVFIYTDTPPTILNGGTSHRIATNDWNSSLDWIKNNTPEGSVVASWWDYGYWIQTKGERATLADNSTLSTATIEKIAKIFLNSPDESWRALQEMGVDYFVVNIAGQRYNVDGNDDQALYALHGGADESKKQWFMRIANEPLEKYLLPDGISGTDYFWNETMLGQMTPFTPIGYINLQTNEQYLRYQPGTIGIYEKDVKFHSEQNGPLKLVYASPSFDAKKGEIILGVFVYEVNKDYIPQN